jgi:uncharacterized membrane protein (UPF0127 family)
MPAKNKTKKKIDTPKKEEKKFKHVYKVITAILFIALVLILIFSNLLKKKEVNTDYMFKKQGTLTFLNSNNDVKAKIDIQIADNDFDRELGLMFRKHMDENQGMLFIFPQDTIQNFWMHNTYIPLDMIFINSNKVIVTIQRATKTLSDQTYASTAPAQYVLEVNLDFSKKFNIQVGDRVEWSRIKTQTNL